jgi:hypothetical protein
MENGWKMFFQFLQKKIMTTWDEELLEKTVRERSCFAEWFQLHNRIRSTNTDIAGAVFSSTAMLNAPHRHNKKETNLQGQDRSTSSGICKVNLPRSAWPKLSR